MKLGFIKENHKLLAMDAHDLKKQATQYGWEFLDWQAAIGMISFTKKVGGFPARINIYTTKMTVATAITHPRKGKTQLYRRNVGSRLMAKIFENPRIHTRKGYQKRR